MTFEQVKITWLLMLIQGCRRLYECLSLSKEDIFSVENTSESKMFGGHWLMGIAFYIAMSISTWIEGIPAIENHQLSPRDLIFKAPTMRTIIGVLLFMLASGFQHDCHAYLAYLKFAKSTPENPAEGPTSPPSSPPTGSRKDKSDSTALTKSSNAPLVTSGEGDYKLPTHPAFQPFICPHYTAECLIYLSLAIVAAPASRPLNSTLLCALVFVVVNLAVTADGTKAWYEKRFGKEAVEGKWRMVPGLW